MSQQNDVTTFSVAVPRAIAEEIKKIAKREMISVSAVVRRLIADHIRSQCKELQS